MAIRKPGPFSLIVLRFLTHASTSLSKMTALAPSVICAFQPARREKGKKELVPSLSGNHMWHFAYVPLFPMVTSIWRGRWEMQPVFCTAAYSTKNGGGGSGPILWKETRKGIWARFSLCPITGTIQSFLTWKLVVFLFLACQIPTPPSSR